MNIKYLFPIIILIVFAVSTIAFVGSKKSTNNNYKPSNSIASDNVDNVYASNVTLENGKQIITIKVDGGYSPKVSNAKSGIPTQVKFVGGSGYDCSHTVNIPSIGFASNIPSNGLVFADLGSPNSGSSVSGTCGMGMYRFNIKFN